MANNQYQDIVAVTKDGTLVTVQPDGGYFTKIAPLDGNNSIPANALHVENVDQARQLATQIFEGKTPVSSLPSSVQAQNPDGVLVVDHGNSSTGGVNQGNGGGDPVLSSAINASQGIVDGTNAANNSGTLQAAGGQSADSDAGLSGVAKLDGSDFANGMPGTVIPGATPPAAGAPYVDLVDGHGGVISNVTPEEAARYTGYTQVSQGQGMQVASGVMDMPSTGGGMANNGSPAIDGGATGGTTPGASTTPVIPAAPTPPPIQLPQNTVGSYNNPGGGYTAPAANAPYVDLVDGNGGIITNVTPEEAAKYAAIGYKTVAQGQALGGPVSTSPSGDYHDSLAFQNLPAANQQAVDQAIGSLGF